MQDQQKRIYEESFKFYWKPILPLFDDEHVSEVMINGPEQIYVERRGRISMTTTRFPSQNSLLAAIRNAAEYNGRDLDAGNPTMDGRFPDGSRIHVILPPAARQGITVTIRRFRKSNFDLGQLVGAQTLTPAAAEYLDLMVKLRRNIIISGGTGSGKTSLLNALSACIPAHERLIVIEDTAELQLASGCHVVSLESRPAVDGGAALTIRELFANSLRMRPDRVIIGEIRRGEALDLIQSMLSGHAGSLSTVHANTPRDALIRLETLCLMSDSELPIYVARQQVASAVNVVVQIVRFDDGHRKVSCISECRGLSSADEHGQYTWNEVFGLHRELGDTDGQLSRTLIPTGVSIFSEAVRESIPRRLIRFSEDVWGNADNDQKRKAREI